MIVKETYLKSLVELSFFIVISGIYLMATDSLINNIISLIILVVGAAVVVKFNITHPYVWYSGAFTLYAIGYPLLVYFDANAIYYGYTKELITLHWVALVTFLIVVNPQITDIRSIRSKVKKFDCVLSTYLYYILSCIVLAFIMYLRMKGYTSKGEVESSGSLVTDSGMRLVLVYILIASIELIKRIYKTNKLDYKIIFITFFLLFFLFFYTAERDLLLRYSLILFLIYYIFYYEKKQKGKLILIITTLFLFIPISRSIKYLGMRGEIQTLSLGSNLIVEFIKSEFHTQARNVQLLLDSQVYEGYFEGMTFITSVTKFFGASDFSSLQWFHETFYATSATGMGFSLVGEGYINLGYIGVILMFTIIGLIINNAYRNSNKSVYNLVIYVMLIPISIYAIRADLYNFLSQYIKQVLFIIIILRFSDKLLDDRKKRRNLYKVGDSK